MKYEDVLKTDDQARPFDNGSKGKIPDSRKVKPGSLSQAEVMEELNRLLMMLQALGGETEGQDGSASLNAIEKEKGPMPLQELSERVINSISQLNPRLLDKEEKVIQEYADLMARSVKTGEACRILLDRLSSTGLRKADKAYVEAGHVSDIHAIAGSRIDRAKKLKALMMNGTDMSTEMQGLFDERFKERAPMRNEKWVDDHMFQEFSQVVPQDGGENMVEEKVYNMLYSHHNECMSILHVHNKKTGEMLEMSDLLPEGYVFVPTEMLELKEAMVLDKGKYRKKITFEPKSLKDFNGTQNSPDDFEMYASFKSIAYGNLDKKGQMLSLLHEIAHAWQSSYHKNNAKVNWEAFYEKLSSALIPLILQREVKDDAVRLDDVLKETREKLSDIGVELKEESPVAGMKTAKGEHIVGLNTIMWKGDDPTWGRSDFLVRSEEFAPLANDYVKEERDAWAMAIKVLRFLRKKGFDLEPELKNMKDFEDLIHYNLGTYQQSLEDEIEPSKDIKQFTNRSKFHSRWPKKE